VRRFGSAIDEGVDGKVGLLELLTVEITLECVQDQMNSGPGGVI
jgi:hypothetical protein